MVPHSLSERDAAYSAAAIAKEVRTISSYCHCCLPLLLQHPQHCALSTRLKSLCLQQPQQRSHAGMSATRNQSASPIRGRIHVLHRCALFMQFRLELGEQRILVQRHLRKRKRSRQPHERGPLTGPARDNSSPLTSSSSSSSSSSRCVLAVLTLAKRRTQERYGEKWTLQRGDYTCL
jgi:hypothetical protein